ncbi:LPS-assembly protein LptD [Roseibium sp. RKSG952]|uniref:LPS-assembly protein LptD n=1 Tax=Roseibium sp. RKSG952 TaxID=2529384 RepID=UPI0012BC8EB6|nr:LPS-assembly protein LptD [Roseibium sp. RKSG952]MTH95759.1 LPS-assembly protein LptD [Roseibium sp. RKSG952]
MAGFRFLLSTTALTRAAFSRRALAAAILSVPSLGGLPATIVQAQENIQEALVGQVDPNANLLLEANQVVYDFDNDVIHAVGDVQVYYDGYTVQAHRITFDRKQDTLVANGNVIFTDPLGDVVRTSSMTLSEDLKNGFAKSLQLDTPQRTRFIAEEATRKDGNVTTFTNGMYTVYTEPTTPPNKPPLWSISSAKIIHNQQERTIYFEDAALEFFGKPIAHVPYFKLPDPTVKRKSGFLTPTGVSSTNLGVGVNVPYYWALDPYYDLLTTVSPLSEQGVLPEAAFRQKMVNGQYELYAAGIIQAQPGKFSGTSGDQRGRGAIKSVGEFRLAPHWKIGWDATLKSDRTFLEDYDFVGFDDNDETSEIYLKGSTTRNDFTIRAYAFQISQEDYTDSDFDAAGFSPVGSDLQEKQPLVHPVVDYDYVFDNPVAGGELSLTSNFYSLTRSETDAFEFNGNDRFRGVAGTFSRLTLEADWRRTYIDPLGQTWMPFAYARGDLFSIESSDDDVTALAGESFVARTTPAIGLEYRYPFIATFQGGNQFFEPVAQVVARPNEKDIGELPNEDAQSIVFDTTTLFDYDKFSGFDRAEGGTRLNVGFNYKLQLDSGYYFTTLVGRSYQIAGENSYEVVDILGATLDSGLETTASDYVGSLYFNTIHGIQVGAQGRFDTDDLAVNRLQVQASGTYGPVVSTLAYAFLDAQPDVGIDDPREEIVGAASLRLEDNWRVFGSMRYDIENSDLVQDGVGIGYDDEGFSLSISYAEDRSRFDGSDVDRTLYLRIGLRTIGNTQVSSGVGD